MRKILLCLFLLSSSFGAYAQKSVLPGYVITQAGDTLKGQVRDRSDARNNLSVEFESNAGVTIYTPEQLKGYGINGQKKYTSTNITTLTYLPEGGTDTTRSVVFLQQLVEGPVSLYFLKTNREPDRFYLERGPGNFSELVKDKRIVKKHGVPHQRTLNFYQDTLRQVFAACPDLAKKTSQLDFVVQDLSKAFMKYNACIQQEGKMFVSVTATRKTLVQASLTLGYAQGRTHYVESGSTLGDYKSQNGVSGGVGFNFSNPAFSKRFSIQAGLDYTRKGVEGYLNSANSSPNRLLLTTIDMECLNSSLMLKLNTHKGPVQPYLGAGLTVGYVLNHETAYLYGRRKDFFPITKTEYGFVAETGARIPLSKRQGFLVSLRYDDTRISFNFSKRGEYYNRYLRLGVGYYFSMGGS